MKNKHEQKKGIALLTAIVMTSILLIVSFVVVNVAYKQIILASANRDSQYAFYAADGGINCVIYWDFVKQANGTFISKFNPSGLGAISCGGSSITPSLVSNSGLWATSTITINFTTGCAIVDIGKSTTGTTTIYSRGYNTCDVLSLRRFERGVTLTY